jgi:hypothetical protein|tara:strand:+ start:242 stop:508 length:267 start_codon:yes stop_codon:yes gene_type:complete
MSASQTGNWAIFYRKLEEPNIWYTMKLWRKDGVLVSAKTYDDVYKFNRFKEAFDFAKNLITEEPTPKYDAEVRRVCKARGNAFYLAGN